MQASSSSSSNKNSSSRAQATAAALQRLQQQQQPQTCRPLLATCRCPRRCRARPPACLGRLHGVVTPAPTGAAMRGTRTGTGAGSGMAGSGGMTHAMAGSVTPATATMTAETGAERMRCDAGGCTHPTCLTVAA